MMQGSLEKLSALPDVTKVFCTHEYTMANLNFALKVDPTNVALKAFFTECDLKRTEDVPTVPSTIGHERMINPFLRWDSAAIIDQLKREGRHNGSLAAEVFGAERKASVSRELTKKFEHTERGTLGELAEWAKSDPKGEFVVVIAGAAGVIRDIHTLVEDVLTLVDSGERLKDAVNQIAELSKVSKSELYQLSLDARRDKQ